MDLGEKILCDETGCITGQDTGRVVAKFSHVAEGIAFKDDINYGNKIGANKAMAQYFYEQCAGATSGHMAMIPNSPVMFSLLKSFSGSNNSDYAVTKEQFADILRDMANDLDA